MKAAFIGSRLDQGFQGVQLWRFLQFVSVKESQDHRCARAWAPPQESLNRWLEKRLSWQAF